MGENTEFSDYYHKKVPKKLLYKMVLQRLGP